VKYLECAREKVHRGVWGQKPQWFPGVNECLNFDVLEEKLVKQQKNILIKK